MDTIDYSNEPQVIGFIVIHTRAVGSTVYFGPFKTLEEVHEWFETVGHEHRVSGYIQPLMNPQGDPKDFWYIADCVTHEEMLKPKGERDYIP
jgi:hypothetical protein